MAKQMQPKPAATGAAAECVTRIVEEALPFRSKGTPTIDQIARLAGQAVRLLRLEAEEASAAQNSAVLELMKRHSLIVE
jgi:hypothetical protein